MPLISLPNDLTYLTPGEKRIFNKISQIYKDSDETCHLYINPRIRDLEPDFVILDPQKGVCIIEVKDWSRDYIETINRRYVFTKDKRKLYNPSFRTNQYFNLFKGMVESNDLLVNDDGKINFNIVSQIIFTNINSREIDEISEVLDQKPSGIICSDKIRNLSRRDLFDIKSSTIGPKQIDSIRSLLFPEIKIKKSEGQDDNDEIDVKVLDNEQEKFARQIPNGHFMVSGVPGSGKTVMLLSRALSLVRTKPDWKILIVTYNKSLVSTLKTRLEQFENDYQFSGIKYENISISTFHKAAMETANLKAPQNATDEWWRNTLPQKALNAASPKYDAVLIDEYQDFEDDWIRLCILLCKKSKYQNSKGDQLESENIFLAGDRLQSIYNSKAHNWKMLGLNLQGAGKSIFLKKTYRTGHNHINMALDFLMSDPSSKNEVEKFYYGRENIDQKIPGEDEIEFIEGQISNLNMPICKLLSQTSMKPSDIMILCPTWELANTLKKELNNEIQKVAEVTKEPLEGVLTITTYHSSKGLEAKACFLMNVDQISLTTNTNTENKLLYVAMTRASKYLFIHAMSFKSDGLAKDIHDWSIRREQ